MARMLTRRRGGRSRLGEYALPPTQSARRTRIPCRRTPAPHKNPTAAAARQRPPRRTRPRRAGRARLGEHALPPTQSARRTRIRRRRTPTPHKNPCAPAARQRPPRRTRIRRARPEGPIAAAANQRVPARAVLLGRRAARAHRHTTDPHPPARAGRPSGSRLAERLAAIAAPAQRIPRRAPGRRTLSHGPHTRRAPHAVPGRAPIRNMPRRRHTPGTRRGTASPRIPRRAGVDGDTRRELGLGPHTRRAPHAVPGRAPIRNMPRRRHTPLTHRARETPARAAVRRQSPRLRPPQPLNVITNRKPDKPLTSHSQTSQPQQPPAPTSRPAARHRSPRPATNTPAPPHRNTPAPTPPPRRRGARQPPASAQSPTSAHRTRETSRIQR